jgi:SAM-dependent methyltransferase
MHTTTHDDQTRLKEEYADRARRLAGSDLYSPFNAAHLFMIQSRQRAVLRMLRRHGITSLAGKRVLEVGCGGGSVLHEWLGYGVEARDLHGAELLLDRLHDAHGWLPHLPLACADGRRLPYASNAFDVVLQSTVFSSILDESIKPAVAREMLRVLRPGGLIVWYDFWLNPTNPQTKGIRPDEIRRLFPGCEYAFQRITLAPPILRRLVGVSWTLCAMLESVRVLNTHYLVGIHRK